MAVNFDPIEPVGPRDEVVTCPVCGRFVVVVKMTENATLVLDPSFTERRWIRSMVGPAAVLRHGFGPGLGTCHKCQGPEPTSRIDSLQSGDQLDN